MGPEPWIKAGEKDIIMDVIMEQKMFGYTDEESLKIVNKRLPSRDISLRSYKHYKSEWMHKNEATGWLTIYARAGYLDSYKGWIRDKIYLKQSLMQEFEHERAKPIEQHNSRKMISLARAINEIIDTEASLGLGAPVLLQMKQWIDKGLASDELLKRFGFPKGNKELREDNKQDNPPDEYTA